MVKRHFIPASLVSASLLAAGLLGSATLAGAQETRHPVFVAALEGSQERPEPAATSAGGAASFVLSAFNPRALHYSIVATDASTAVMAAHIHLGGPEEVGPVVVTLCSPQTTPCASEGVIAQGSATADQFSGPLQGRPMAALVNAMGTGNAYVNVHTTKYPGGEIRGQTTSVVPGEFGLLDETEEGSGE